MPRRISMPPSTRRSMCPTFRSSSLCRASSPRSTWRRASHGATTIGQFFSFFLLWCSLSLSLLVSEAIFLISLLHLTSSSKSSERKSLPPFVHYQFLGICLFSPDFSSGYFGFNLIFFFPQANSLAYLMESWESFRSFLWHSWMRETCHFLSDSHEEGYDLHWFLCSLGIAIVEIFSPISSVCELEVSLPVSNQMFLIIVWPACWTWEALWLVNKKYMFH